jgi:ABC-type bacteriocin/lantibiotic exporter with double-glycine peptidase domain
MQTIKKLLFLLTPNERKNAGLLLIMIMIMAFLEMIGVASILPFMAVLTNPSIIETNFILKTTFEVSKDILGVQNNQQFLFGLGFIVFLLLVTSLSFKVLTIYTQVRFVQMREYSIGKRLVEEYLHQPYSWFLSRHSADIGKTILSEVQQIVGGGINPLIELIAKSIVAITLISLLIVVNPKLALIVGFSLGLAYLFIFYFVRNFLKKAGQIRLQNNQFRFTLLNEAFSATKEIKIGGLEKNYVNSFSSYAKNYAKANASSLVISQMPRFILEAIAFGGVLLIILYTMLQTGNFNNALPIISLYVFAGYRLMPALQQVYSSFTQLTFIVPSLNKLYDDLNNLHQYNENQNEEIVTFDKKIVLKNINFSYPKSSQVVLKDINLTIPAKSTVGFIGTTGSGKTTIIDIILGLLEAQKGTLEIDNRIISKKNLRSWQSQVGYVPQSIYLSDNTVAANIAFGVKPKDINYELVEEVSKIANLNDFIVNELPEKYQTNIGERGVKLSGGQRQRIGIARALYHNPKILILDEATSALDNETEKSVMDAVNNLSKSITIILIAHRLNTVKNCDIVFKLSKGKLIGQGSFEEII